jgi:hypothetical protein
MAAEVAAAAAPAAECIFGIVSSIAYTFSFSSALNHRTLASRPRDMGQCKSSYVLQIGERYFNFGRRPLLSPMIPKGSVAADEVPHGGAAEPTSLKARDTAPLSLVAILFVLLSRLQQGRVVSKWNRLHFDESSTECGFGEKFGPQATASRLVQATASQLRQIRFIDVDQYDHIDIYRVLRSTQALAESDHPC